jgi:hypothetical protein
MRSPRNSLNAGPRALAEADSAAMNAAAANMRTEGAFVVAADPAQFKPRPIRPGPSTPFPCPCYLRKTLRLLLSFLPAILAKLPLAIASSRPLGPLLARSICRPPNERRRTGNRVAARAIKAAELGSAAQLSYQSTNMKRKSIDDRDSVGGHRRSFTRPEPYAQWTEDSLHRPPKS